MYLDLTLEAIISNVRDTHQDKDVSQFLYLFPSHMCFSWQYDINYYAFCSLYFG